MKRVFSLVACFFMLVQPCFGWQSLGWYSGGGGTSASVSTATDSSEGVSELATDAETVTGTATDRVTTPANITAKMAAPGAIGGTTPAAGTFTGLTSTMGADKSSGDANSFNSGAGFELTDSDNPQSWINLSPKFNQSGNASGDCLYINPTETALGSSDENDYGNNYLRCGNEAKITLEGEIIGGFKEYTKEAGNNFNHGNTSTELTVLQCKGGQVNNFDQEGNVVLTLPTAVEGLTLTAVMGTSVTFYYRLDPQAADRICLDGAMSAAGKYVGTESAALGEIITMRTFYNDSDGGGYDWLASTVSGNWTAES